MPRTLTALVALLALALFAACGGDDGGGATTGSTSATDDTTAPTDDTSATEPSGDVTAIPFPGNSAEALAVDENGVWVVDPIEATVTQIDPDVAEVVTTIDVPGAVDIASDESGVWVASEAQGIVPIDPTTATAGAPIDPGIGLDNITVGEGSIWVDGGFDDAVVRVDPATSTAGSPIAVGAFPTYIVVGDGAAYVSNLDDRTITRIDAADDGTSEISLGDDDSGLTRGGGPIAYGGGYLWAEGTDTELCRVSPDGADVECVDIGTDINALAADETRVWIAAVDGQVLVVDTDLLEVVATVETGGVSLDSIAVGDGAVWVTDASANESTVFRIDS
jgi:hypothetical protein